MALKKLIKIVLVGPESTGKTTLAQALAQHFNTNWVREYLRDFAQDKQLREGKALTPSDNLALFTGQLALEKEAEETAKVFLFCDTNFIQTKIYSEIYFKQQAIFIDESVKKFDYNLYLLTQIDIPWEPDPLRDAPDKRIDHYNYFRNRLLDHKVPFMEISGNFNERLQKATQISSNLKLALEKGFTSEDLIDFSQRNISIENVLKHLHIFENRIPYIRLNRAALTGDGILQLNDLEKDEKIAYFEQHRASFRIEKMIPASGAASRMFQFLSKFLREFDPEKDTINAYINRHKAHELETFFTGIEKFPFYKNVKQLLKSNFADYKSWSKDRYYATFVKLLLSENYLGLSNLPKGVLTFHKNQTPIEEHLREALYHTGNQHTTIHFTVSEEHLELFKKAKNVALEHLGYPDLDIRFSFQKKSTDVIAVHFDCTPFREKDGKILFRQAGHGALLENLNESESDIVFIKNIDNVSPTYFDEVIRYKKILGGLLIELQDQIFKYLHLLDATPTPNQSELDQISYFALTKLNITLPENFQQINTKTRIDFLKNKLNRPIRVCGMVRNEGEPGGGPFWVLNDLNEQSLQIVETSQIDKTDEEQKKILDQSTHFNPVDLVCGIRDYKGNPFNLLKYRDDNTGFLTEKTKDGFPILGYELPGLWNGAMADWISVFVEVPTTTFSPVKTINDLLKPAHQ